VPELNFSERAEILSAIKYVDEVVPCHWLIDEEFLDLHSIDQLIHGHDNTNPISSERLLVLPRTEGISSNLLRSRILKSVAGLMEIREK
jgi:glycerol-3-phosphate cytidylyltransferase-like family protein